MQNILLWIFVIFLVIFIGFYIYNREENNNNGNQCKGVFCPLTPQSVTFIKTSVTYHYWSVSTKASQMGQYLLMPVDASEKDLRSTWQIGSDGTIQSGALRGYYVCLQSKADTSGLIPLVVKKTSAPTKWKLIKRPDHGIIITTAENEDFTIVELNNRYVAAKSSGKVVKNSILEGTGVFITYNSMLPIRGVQ